MTGIFKKLNVETLVPSPKSIRKPQLKKNDFDYLVNSIRSIGFLEDSPVVVTDEGNGVYKIIDGLQRYTAARKLGFMEVPCYIAPNMSEADEMILQFSKNVCRVSTDPSDQAAQILKYAALPGNINLTQAELAKIFNVSQGYISSVMRLNSIHPDVKEAVLNGNITFARACALGKHIPTGFQHQFLDLAKENSPLNTFIDLLKAHRKEILNNGRISPNTNIRTFKVLSKDELIKRLEVAESQLTNLTSESPHFIQISERVAVFQETLCVDPETIARGKESEQMRKDNKAREILSKKQEKYEKEAQALKQQLQVQQRIAV